MTELDPNKLHVSFQAGASARELLLQRRYTLTHSDSTGNLFLTIGKDYNRKQVSGFYTRLMRGEVLAELKSDGQGLSLQVYCHVSGGLVFGSANMRNDILHQHMRMVIEAFRCGDHELVSGHPELDELKVWVHYSSDHARYNQVEDWGLFQTYG